MRNIKILLIIFYLLLFLLYSCKEKSTEVQDNGINDIVKDIDGNIYRTVKIGDQWWMAENLKVIHYRNGDNVKKVINGTEWSNLLTGAYCCYNNEFDSISTYGLLYNWHALKDSRNIAPEGWHVPSDAEWNTLEIFLGIDQLDTDSKGWRGINEGNKLKSNSGWKNNGNGNDSCGFTALPAGCYYDYTIGFADKGSGAYFWSSTEYSSNSAWIRYLGSYSSGIYRNIFSKKSGLSIRCIKD